MDFIDPDKKRKNTIKLYIGYVLIGLAVVLGSIVLLFYALGYGIGRTGSVVRSGLVFIDSDPDGANVVIEHKNKVIKQDKTNTRLNIPEGNYQVTLTRQGYLPWKRSFHLDGGGVERMQYPFLFPENLATSDVQSYSKPTTFVTNSPDRRWIVVQSSTNLLTFDLLDGNQSKVDQKVRTISFSPSLFALNNKDDKLQLVEWSTDNKNMLVRHTFGNSQEYAMLNIEEPDKSVNIDKVFSKPYSTIKLRDKKFDSLYLLDSSGNLFFGNLTDKTTKQISKDVLDFKPHGNNTILLITKKNALEVNVTIWSEEKEYVLRTLPAGATYLLDIAQFDGSWYMVVGAKSENQMYVYKNPLDWLKNPQGNQTVFARTLRLNNPQNVSFSANTRFIAAQSGQSFTVYDAETDRQYNYTLDETFQDSAKWMDGHRLTAISKGRVIVFDFDGINKVTLSSALQGTYGLFDRDYEELYTFAPKDGGTFVLTRSELVVRN